MENHITKINSIFDDHIDLFTKLKKSMAPKINTLAKWIIKGIEGKHKVLLAGNGGSAADSQHIAAEFVGRFRRERFPMAAIALTTDSSILTAIGNDYGFEKVFSRHLEALMNHGDIFIALSTSGNSKNLIEAVNFCREKGYTSIGFLGKNGGKLGEMVDLPIVIESQDTARIQEAHITIGHIICEIVESSLCDTYNLHL